MSSISSFLRDRRGKRSEPFIDHTQETRGKRWNHFSRPELGRLVESGTTFLEDTPAPLRPSYDLTTNAPERPLLPIYESFTSTKDSGYSEHNKRDVEPNGGHRLRRVTSVADLRARSARDSVAPTPSKLPFYDRSAELAKLYQSVMPDFDAMFEGDDDNTAEKQREKQRSAQCQPDTIDADTRLPPPFKEKSEKRKARALATHLVPALDQAQSDSSITSLTVMESNDFVDAPTHHAVHGNENENENGTIPRPRSCSSPWPIGIALSTPDCSSKPPPRDVAPEFTISAARARALSEPQAQRRHRYLLSQRGSIVLHVCTEKLVKQLTEALAVQRQGVNFGLSNDDGKKVEQLGSEFQSSLTQMQLLLMIEAYKGVLESCRREMLLSHLWQSAAEADGYGLAGRSGDTERSAAREAVPVLEHWLATLNFMYEGLAKGR